MLEISFLKWLTQAILCVESIREVRSQGKLLLPTPPPPPPQIGETVIEETHTVVSFAFRSTTSSSLCMQKNIPSYFWERLGGKESLKYTRAFCSQQGLPSGESIFTRASPIGVLCYQSLTNLGEGKYTTPVPSSHHGPPKGFGVNQEALVQFTTQWHRLTKRLECFPSESCFTCYTMPGFQQKSQSVLKGKRHSLKRQSQDQNRLRYDHGVWIIRPGM